MAIFLELGAICSFLMNSTTKTKKSSRQLWKKITFSSAKEHKSDITCVISLESILEITWLTYEEYEEYFDEDILEHAYNS